MILSKLQKFFKLSKLVKRGATIKECFYHKKDECKGPIKQSHSIQRNRRLAIIEGKVNGNSCIYSFSNPIPSKDTLFNDLAPLGKNEASTFYGFCDYHDSVLFAPVENNEFDASPKHCFLHSYRAFAHSYHTEKEAMRLFSHVYPKIPLFKNVLFKGLDEKKRDFDDYTQQKMIIDSAIENADYNRLKYFIFEKEGLFPIACSANITPPVSYNNNVLNNFDDIKTKLTALMLTVLPDVKKSFCIIAAFKGENNAIAFIKELWRLKSSSIEKVISSLLISCAENTFFSPKLWEKLGEDGRMQLLGELKLHYPKTIPEYQKRFFISKINFYDNRFRESIT